MNISIEFAISSPNSK